ncbi:MAG: MarR family transcriptional regulator [Lachnospiraceae bacterium]|nr:MarR family transcriptional regulator [Lachnospiraceae bacterium]
MKHLEEIIEKGELNFDGMEASFFLLGVLSAFDNRYQAKADSFFEDISWKQFFVIICINLCKNPPTIKELAEITGSSHQNVKQILIKLEKKGYIQTLSDETDKRKQRIVLTEKTRTFCESHDEESEKIVHGIFAGIDPQEIAITIKTILQMEKNLEDIM